MIARSVLALVPLIVAVPAVAGDAGSRVATVVVVKTPPGATRAVIDEGFRKSVPLYAKIPGLVRKYFTVNDGGFGGMYLWKDRAAAEAWFTPAWAAQCRARYGSDCQVTWFDSPLQLEGAAAKK